MKKLNKLISRLRRKAKGEKKLSKEELRLLRQANLAKTLKEKINRKRALRSYTRAHQARQRRQGL